MYRGLSNQILAQSINLGNYKLVNMYIFCTKRGKKNNCQIPFVVLLLLLLLLLFVCNRVSLFTGDQVGLTLTEI